MKKPTKILVFGSFDLIHKGHEFFLKQAKKLGDELNVVVARDSTIKFFKKSSPLYKEKERLKHIKQLKYVDKAVLGSKGKDKHKIIQKIMPDIIAFGYDQNSFNKNIKKELAQKGLDKIKIKKIRSYKPKEFKSSILKSKKQWGTPP